MPNVFNAKMSLVFIVPIVMGFLSINPKQHQEVMNPFITHWDVSGGDTSSIINTVTIPLQSGTYNFNYTWTLIDDPNIQISGTHTSADGDFITTFTTGKFYELSIEGSFPHLRNYEKNKLLDVIQWGDIQWRNMQEMFENWPGVDFSATDAPDLSSVTSMVEMFRNASNFNGNIGNWDVSNITNLFRLFQGASSFNQDIGNWIVSNVEILNATFENASSFNQDISGWNVSKVNGLNNTFRGADQFNQNIGVWDVSSVESMTNTFLGNDAFNQDLSLWDVSNVSSFRETFKSASAFNQSLGNWKFKAGADFREFLVGATAMDCQSWSSTILGWNFSNPNLNGLNVGSIPHLEFDTIAAIAMDELVNERAWTFSGTPFIGNCGATFEFPCSDTLQIENETLFGDINIPAGSEVILKDVDFIQPSNVTMTTPQIRIKSFLVVSIGANINLLNEAGCN
jgi:surface protein